MPMPSTPRLWCAMCLLGAPAAVLAQTETPPVQLPPVVVTATRIETPAFDVPAAITRIDGDQVRDGRAQVNISESLAAVPGLVARDRQNYAQDVQISVRGFGARSTFGIRGVRLYVDGIPATLPDGQGQITNVELGSVDRIEVLRGPFSALYGNSSGGVLQVFTEEGRGRPRVGFEVSGGSDGLLRVATQASGAEGSFGYRLGASRFHTDGYRDHSSTTRHLGNAKLTLRPDDEGKLTLVLNSVSLPEAQDPLGLTRAQFEANPRGVDAAALDFNTRKTVDQTQGGLLYERRVDAANKVQATVYLGQRGTEQYQSIPTGPQAGERHPGGLISLERRYDGADLRWSWTAQNLSTPLTVVGGLSIDELAERRKGYRNYIGSTLGVKGDLKRDENNDVTAADQYVQANWQPAADWTVNAGVRHSRVRFRSTDRYIVGTNPDDSGGAVYSATLPVLGVLYAVNENVHLYATAGRGFETPTLNELSYRANGATGLNFDLQPARSRNLEAGVKWRLAGWGEADLAVFETRTEREIVTETNSGGRATFQNAGKTLRRGAELGWSAQWHDGWRAQLAATALEATYRDAFSTCTATPCSVATQTTIPSGNRIPGIPRSSLYAGVNYSPNEGVRGGVELRHVGSVAVNDTNSDAAEAYTVASAHLGYRLVLQAWDLGSFARVDNLFDKAHIGSVIVNDGNARYFEPAPGRTWLVGVSATRKF